MWRRSPPDAGVTRARWPRVAGGFRMAVRTKDGGRRATVVAVSAVAMGLGTTPPFLLGYLGPQIRADLNLSRGQLGLLIGLFYGLTGLGSLGTARVAERWGARRCLVVDLTVVVACLAGTALSGSAVLLAITAVLTGAGYSLTNAGSSMAVAATAPRGRAAQDLTVKTAGVPLMATVLAVAGPPVGAIVGWRGGVGGAWGAGGPGPGGPPPGAPRPP